jgi:hypothetical protein
VTTNQYRTVSRGKWYTYYNEHYYYNAYGGATTSDLFCDTARPSGPEGPSRVASATKSPASSSGDRLRQYRPGAAAAYQTQHNPRLEHDYGG